MGEAKNKYFTCLNYFFTYELSNLRYSLKEGR